MSKNNYYPLTIEDNIIVDIDYSDESIDGIAPPANRVFFIPKEVTDIIVEGLINFHPFDIQVEEGNPVFESIDHCLIRRADRALMMVSESGWIPGLWDIKAIGPLAFNRYHDITKMDHRLLFIPDSVERIDYRAYAVYSAKPVQITVPASVQSIALMAFMIHSEGNVLIKFEGDPKLEVGAFGTRMEGLASDHEIFSKMPECIYAPSEKLTVIGPAGSGVEKYCERFGIMFKNWEQVTQRTVYIDHGTLDREVELANYKVLRDLGYKFSHRPWFAMPGHTHRIITVHPDMLTGSDAGPVNAETMTMEEFIAEQLKNE